MSWNAAAAETAVAAGPAIATMSRPSGELDSLSYRVENSTTLRGLKSRHFPALPAAGWPAEMLVNIEQTSDSKLCPCPRDYSDKNSVNL